MTVAIDFDEVLKRGGNELIQFLHFCVYSVELAPVFVALARDYRFSPTVPGALALHANFCALGAPARIKADAVLAPGDAQLEQLAGRLVLQKQAYEAAFAKIAEGADEIAPSQPPRRMPASPSPVIFLFDKVVAHLRSDLEGSLHKAARAFDPAREPEENLPGGRLNADQRAFLEDVWRPHVRPQLVAAGFRRAANVWDVSRPAPRYGRLLFGSLSLGGPRKNSTHPTHNSPDRNGWKFTTMGTQLLDCDGPCSGGSVAPNRTSYYPAVEECRNDGYACERTLVCSSPACPPCSSVKTMAFGFSVAAVRSFFRPVTGRPDGRRTAPASDRKSSARRGDDDAGGGAGHRPVAAAPRAFRRSRNGLSANPLAQAWPARGPAFPGGLATPDGPPRRGGRAGSGRAGGESELRRCAQQPGKHAAGTRRLRAG